MMVFENNRILKCNIGVTSCVHDVSFPQNKNTIL
jgi:hypothetical protein